MIVLDAGVLIAHLESTDAHNGRATQLLLSAAEDQMVVSPITMAEVLVGPARAHQLERFQGILRDLELTTVPLTEDSPVGWRTCGRPGACGCPTAASYWLLKWPAPPSRRSTTNSPKPPPTSAWRSVQPERARVDGSRGRHSAGE